MIMNLHPWNTYMVFQGNITLLKKSTIPEISETLKVNISFFIYKLNIHNVRFTSEVFLHCVARDDITTYNVPLNFNFNFIHP